MNFKINSRIYILTIVFIVIIFILLCTYKNIENYVPYGGCGSDNMFEQGYTFKKNKIYLRDPLLPVSCNRNNQQGIYIRNFWDGNQLKHEWEKGWNSYLNEEDVIQKEINYYKQPLVIYNPASPQYEEKKNNTKWEIKPVPDKKGHYYIKVLNKDVYLYAVDGPKNDPTGKIFLPGTGIKDRLYHYIDFIDITKNTSTTPHLYKYKAEEAFETRREWIFIRAGRQGGDSEEGFFRIKNVGTQTDLFLINSSWHEKDKNPYWNWYIQNMRKRGKPIPNRGALFGVGQPLHTAVYDDKSLPPPFLYGQNIDNLWYLEKVSESKCEDVLDSNNCAAAKTKANSSTYDTEWNGCRSRTNNGKDLDKLLANLLLYENCKRTCNLCPEQTHTTSDIYKRQEWEKEYGSHLEEREKQEVQKRVKICMNTPNNDKVKCSNIANEYCTEKGLLQERCTEWQSEMVSKIEEEKIRVDNAKNRLEQLKNCKDKHIDLCPAWAKHDNKYCELPRSKEWMLSECKLSCNNCLG